jgi:hypothetical protein
VGVQGQCVEAIILCDLGGDSDITLVAKVAAELKVMDGEAVVRGFGPVGNMLVLGCRLSMDRLHTDHEGSTSRSEAMFTKLLVTSLWQYLFWTPNALDPATANFGRGLN